jgi:hypothetical protein
MNRSPDVDLVLHDYFADDGWTAPDHVLDAIEERIMRQPQQRAWRLLRRDTHVNSYLKPLLAVAAVIVLAVAGIAYFGQPSDSGVGGAASPAPSPSPVVSSPPSAASSAGAAFPDWYPSTNIDGGAGILPAGNVTTQSFVPGSRFIVPEGWVNDIDTADFFGLIPDTPANQAEFASSRGPAQSITMGLVDTPTIFCDEIESRGSSAAELADSMVANEALVTSDPVEVTIGGLSGTRVDAHIDPDWTGSCQPFNTEASADIKDYRGRFVFLDMPDGRMAIFVQSLHAADFETLLAEAMPIVESFQFEIEQ